MTSKTTLILSWLFFLCYCYTSIKNLSIEQLHKTLENVNVVELYTSYQSTSSTLKCAWFLQVQKLKVACQAKEFLKKETCKKKELAKARKEIALARVFTYRRCKVSFSSNTKFYQHLREGHAKKISTTISWSTRYTRLSQLLYNRSIKRLFYVILFIFYISLFLLYKVVDI